MSDPHHYDNEILDTLDEYWTFKREAAKGIDGAYCGYVYGHIEFNDEFYKDRMEISQRLDAAIRSVASRDGS